MPTLFDPVQRQKQITRLKKLRPDTRPAWGRMTAGDLLPHLADPMRTAIGQYPVAPWPTFWSTKLGQWLVIYGTPKWPKGAATNPKYDISQEGRKGGDFQEDMVSLLTVLERFVDLSDAMEFYPHGSVGKISNASWGRLMDKHFEHHFRQFGI